MLFFSVLISFLLRLSRVLAKSLKTCNQVKILKNGLSHSISSEYCSKYHVWSRKDTIFSYLNVWFGFKFFWNTILCKKKMCLGERHEFLILKKCIFCTLTYISIGQVYCSNSFIHTFSTSRLYCFIEQLDR